MLKHIIMWNWHEHEDPERTTEKLSTIRNALESQVGKIDGCLSVDVVASNVFVGPNSNELLVEMTFTDRDALLAYHKHPLHDEVKGIVDPMVRNFNLVDYIVS